MAMAAARPLVLLASASAALGVGPRAWPRLAVSSSTSASGLPRPAVALRGRRSFAAAASGAVMGKAGPGAVDADAGMDAVQRRLMFEDDKVDCFLFMVRDVKLSPNPEEVANVKYMNHDHLKELIRKADAGEDGVKLSPWFRLVVDNFLMSWWDHVEQGTLQEAADTNTSISCSHVDH